MDNYFYDAISFKNLYSGLKKSCKNVRWKDSVVGYENNGLKNTIKLRDKLLNNTYSISKYQIFQIFEPKQRTIVAARLVDRQFQRALCDSGLYEDITEHFIRDNVACQVNKGTDDAINRLKVHLRRYYRKHGTHGWVLKCDIHHFFKETQHDVAKRSAKKYISDPLAVNAVYMLIDSFSGEKGIGLGSQISQLIELTVLNDLDHFIKERLHIKYYIRYMDDFILIHEDKDYLKYCRIEIENKLKEIGLELNDKTALYPLSQGVKFLHWRFLLTDSGKVILRIERKKLSKQKTRMKKLWEKEKCGEVDPGTTFNSLKSWIANAERGNTFNEQAEMIKFYEKLIMGGENDEATLS